MSDVGVICGVLRVGLSELGAFSPWLGSGVKELARFRFPISCFVVYCDFALMRGLIGYVCKTSDVGEVCTLVSGGYSYGVGWIFVWTRWLLAL